MMRRKLGILILAGVTVLAGTQEAMRQFEGLRSSLNDWTRASLWSGLIVYAQPVSEGKLPAPQIYYLMPPPPQTSPAAPQQPLLADNHNNADAAKPETKNNHVAEELAAAGAGTEALPPSVEVAREIEDAAKSELVLNEVATQVVATRVHVAPKVEKVRVYEEIARHEAGARKFKAQADVVARVFVKEKEFDAAKLEAELAKLAAVQEQLENAKLKSFADADHSGQRHELKVLRRGPRPERPEHPERIRVVAPHVHRRPIALPDISSIGCEKMKNESKPAAVAAVESTVVAAGMAASVRIASEPAVAAGAELPFAAPFPSSTSWALGCDTEPEYSK